ncbi:hydrogenase maturation protease [Fervidicoccus fontis Kam940]|uniref:Hydrogenase maturation protease n=2 Tax=Fervidicoccus fontis TaxID=683846 RepID=I0A2S4_FERFK|nr:hydrogenase maturation protease [Fervidicoccus fontis]AFH43281.1 hydrogenase maturation protease [Fervidicoccus fontis Kam940]
MMIQEKLKNLLNEKKALIICLGNELREDDGVGPYICDKLNCKNTVSVDVPENLNNKAFSFQPDVIVIIDSVDFGASPGSILITEGISDKTSISIHKLPIRLIFDAVGLKAEKIFLIGIQPKSLNFGEQLSEEVKNSADFLIEQIKEQFSCL